MTMENRIRAGLEALPPGIRATVRAWIERPGFSGRLARAEIDPLRADVEDDVFLRGLLRVAAGFASAPISRFPVGAVARGASGDLYLGANLEFEGAAMSAVLHAEQAAVLGAVRAGEAGIASLAVSAAPCGLCRQFLRELDGADLLEVAIARPAPPGEPAGELRRTTLGELLPRAFGPDALGVDRGLLADRDLARLELAARPEDPLLAAALEQASRAHAPYSGNRAGAAILAADGSVHAAPCVENAAFNPTVPAFVAALSALCLSGRSLDDADRAALVETEAAASSERGAAEAIARALRSRRAGPLELTVGLARSAAAD